MPATNHKQMKMTQTNHVFQMLHVRLTFASTNCIFCVCLKPLWSGFLWTNLRYSDVKTCWWKGILLKWLSPCAADPNHVRWAETEHKARSPGVAEMERCQRTQTADTERLKIWEINNMASENRKQCWWWWWSCVKVREGFLKERTWKVPHQPHVQLSGLHLRS